MTYYFKKILTKHGIEKHDGRSLWQYNLSKNDLDQLKIQLAISINNFKGDADSYSYPVDVALYFAEYWRQMYDGGKPSIKMILDSLGADELKHKLVYEIAIKGAERLQLKWINIGVNDLKFRTILSQGGIPLNFIKSSDSNFVNFLKRIIQSDISSVEELNEYFDIISILPKSFRNEFIFDSSFQIINDVLAGRYEIGEKDTENNELKDLIQIIEEEIRIRERRKKSDSVKLSWFLKGSSDLKLFCTIDLPSKISPINNDRNVYNVCFGDKYIGKYKRNHRGEFILNGRNSVEREVGTEDDTNIYVDGKSNTLKLINPERPNFEQPSLWRYEEKDYIYMSSSATKESSAVVFYNENWTLFGNQNIISTDFKISDFGSFSKVDIEDDIKFESAILQSEVWIKVKADEEYSISYRNITPEWLESSQYKVFNKVPSILIYDSDEKLIHDNHYSVNYRFFGEDKFNESISLLKVGLYELKVSFESGLELHDFIYFVNSFSIESKSGNEREGTYLINNTNEKFEVAVSSNDDVNVNREKDELLLKNINISSRPKTFKFRIKNENQNRACNIYLRLPFQGIYIVNNKQKVVKEDAPLLLNNTLGFRVFTPSDKSKKFIAKLYNSHYLGIKMEMDLLPGSNDLIQIQDVVNKLMLFSSLSTGIPKVNMDIGVLNTDGVFLRKSTYTFLKFNTRFATYEDEDTIKEEVEVYAIPFNVDNDLITTYELDYNEIDGSYTITNLPEEIKEFCLITNSKEYVSLPKYFNYSESSDFKIYLKKEELGFIDRGVDRPNYEILQARKIRIETIAENLKKSSIFDEESEWNVLQKYIDLCLTYNLPFNTFDHINAIAKDYDLYANFTVYLLGLDIEPKAIVSIIEKVEDNIGVSLLWVPVQSWIEIFSDNELDFQIIAKLNIVLKIMYDSNIYAMEITKFIMSADEYISEGGSFEINDSPHNLRGLIQNLRQNIGSKINELPQTFPDIEHCYRKSLPMNGDTHPALITALQSPLAVALSLLGKSTRIWKESVDDPNANTEFIKREILFISNQYPDWYYGAIYFFIKQNIN